MKTKRIIAGASLLFGALALASCEAKQQNTTIPYGSIGDSVYASAGKYEITNKQLYTKLRSKSYSEFSNEIYKIVYKTYIDEVFNSYKTSDETKAEINSLVTSNCYSTGTAKSLYQMKEKTKKESVLKYIESMKKKGIVLTADDIDAVSNPIITDSNDDSRLDTVAYKPFSDAVVKYYAYEIGLKHASKEYFKTIVDKDKIYDYGKESLVDNTHFIDEDTLTTRYDSYYKAYNNTNAIIIRFNSVRDANEAIEKVEAKLGKISKENALEFYVELYNTYYSYRTKLTIENGSLVPSNSLTYVTDKDNAELSDISSSFSTFYQNALENSGYSKNDTTDECYTAFPRSIDDKYFMVYKIDTNYKTGTKEAVDFKDLEATVGKDKYNEIVTELKDGIIDSKSSVSHATSSLFKQILLDGDYDNTKDDILSLEIYDPYYESQFYNTYASEDYYSYISKNQFNSNLLAKVTYNNTTTDITVDSFYDSLQQKNGATTSTDYLLNLYLADTYKDKWLTEDQITEFEDTIKNAIKRFKAGESSINKNLGVENYLTINYGYQTEAEVLTQDFIAASILSKYTNTHYRDGYFIADGDSFKINDDVNMFKNMLEYTAKVYNTIYSMDTSHFLISVDDNCDGSIDDPRIFRDKLSPEMQTKFDAEVINLTKALITEANFIKANKLDALKYLLKEYNAGSTLKSPEYAGKTWDDFKYTFNFKLTVEDLGEITETNASNYVPEFKEYVEDVYYQVAESSISFTSTNTYFFLKDLTTSTGSTDTSKITLDNICETEFGYHVLVINDYQKAKNAKYSESSDTNKDYANIKVIVDEVDEDNDDDDIYFVTNAYNDSTENISINQLYIYFYEQLVDGSVTSLSSSLKNAISSMLTPVMSRYSDSNNQKWLELNELGAVTINSSNITYTYADYINSLKVAVDGYDEPTTFAGWFEKDWKN